MARFRTAGLHGTLHGCAEAGNRLLGLLIHWQTIIEAQAVAIFTRRRKQRTDRHRIFSSRSSAFSRTASKASGSSIHIRKLPCGRETQMPQGK